MCKTNITYIESQSLNNYPYIKYKLIKYVTSKSEIEEYHP